jgi:tricorn protease-like protein
MKRMSVPASTGLLVLTALICLAGPGGAAEARGGVAGSIDERMFRYPAVSATQIAFAYAGDIWIAPKVGGTDLRLSSPRGEETLPRFSPDGSMIAFSANYDGNEDIYVVPAGGGLPRRVTHHGAPDRVLGWYAGDKDNRHSAIVLFDYTNGQRHEVTSGFYDDEEPVFDPDGKYLFFRTGRDFSPAYSELENTWIYANTWRLAVVPLRKEVVSPLAPRNDEDPDKDKEKKEDEEKKDMDKKEPGAESKKDEAKPAEAKDEKKPAAKGDEKKEDKPGEKKEDKKPKPVQIDLEAFEERVVLLPPKAGRFDDLCCVTGKLIYRSLPRVGSDATTSPVEFYDLEKRETKRILDDADSIELSATRDKILARKGTSYSIIEPKEGQNMTKKVDTAGLEAMINPVAEWR